MSKPFHNELTTVLVLAIIWAFILAFDTIVFSMTLRAVLAVGNTLRRSLFGVMLRDGMSSESSPGPNIWAQYRRRDSLLCVCPSGETSSRGYLMYFWDDTQYPTGMSAYQRTVAAGEALPSIALVRQHDTHYSNCW